MKAIRIELLIATLALLASAAASIATVVQTSVVGRQLSASVWPYLTIEDSTSETEGGVKVINEGLGPAIVQSVSLTVGGKPYERWSAAIRAMYAGVPHRVPLGPYTSTSHDFGYGSVVRAGDSVQLIDVRSKQLFEQRIPVSAAPVLSVCYCSILQQCWVTDQAVRGQPHSVTTCDKSAPAIGY